MPQHEIDDPARKWRRLTLRLLPTEKRRLREIAQSAGLTDADWIRRQIAHAYPDLTKNRLVTIAKRAKVRR